MKIKMVQGILNVLIFIAVVVLVFVIGYPQYKELQPSHIRIGVDNSYGSLPFYAAKLDTSRKYFELEKINPEFIATNRDPLEAVKKGTVDIASVPWYDLLLSAGMNGDTVKVIGSLELRAVSDAVIIPKKSTKIKSWKDLNGKRLGCLVADEYLLNLMLPLMAQDNVKKIVKVPLKPDELTGAIKDNKADALFLLDPYRSYMINQGDTVLYEGLIDRYIMNDFPYLAIVMRKGFLKTDIRAATRMKNALDAAIGFLRVHPEIGKSTIVKINDWSCDGALLFNIKMPEYQRLIEIDIKHVEELQTLMVKAGTGSCGIRPQDLLFEKTDFTK